MGLLIGMSKNVFLEHNLQIVEYNIVCMMIYCQKEFNLFETNQNCLVLVFINLLFLIPVRSTGCTAS